MDKKLSKTTVILHWLIALGMISLLAVGFYMSNTDTYSLYPIHKSFGMIILVLALVRIIWRIKKGFPEASSNFPKSQLLIAKVVHWILITSTALLPISGMMMSGGSGRGLYIFGFELLAKNVSAEGKPIAINEAAASLGHTLHESLPWLVIAALVLHIIGALKHHVVDKDRTLNRMLGK